MPVVAGVGLREMGQCSQYLVAFQFAQSQGELATDARIRIIDQRVQRFRQFVNSVERPVLRSSTAEGGDSVEP